MFPEHSVIGPMRGKGGSLCAQSINDPWNTDRVVVVYVLRNSHLSEYKENPTGFWEPSGILRINNNSNNN